MKKSHLQRLYGFVFASLTGLTNLACVALLSISQQAAAAYVNPIIPISLINSSFETPNITGSMSLVDTEVLNQSLQDWHAHLPGSGTIALRDGYDANFTGTSGSPGTLPGTAEGQQYMRFHAVTAFDSVYINYIPSISAQANTKYTLTAAVGQEINQSGGSAHITLTLDGIDVAVTSLYDVITGIPNDTFIDLSTFFTTGASDAGKSLGIELRVFGSGGAAFDNIRLTSMAVVPLPPAVWLFGSGVIGLIGVARPKTRV